MTKEERARATERKNTVADVPSHERVPQIYMHLKEAPQRKPKHNRTMCDKNAYFTEIRIKRGDVKILMDELA